MVTPFTRRRLARHRRRGAAGHPPGRRQAHDGLVRQRHHRRVADHHRRREGRRCCGRSRGRRRPGHGSSPASAPTTPRTRRSWPGAAEKAGADGLLVVTPYYTRARRRPACCAHFTAVADADRTAGDALRHPGRTGRADRVRHHPAGSPSTRTSSRSRTPRATSSGSGRSSPRPIWRTTRATTRSTCRWLAMGAVGLVGVLTHVCRPAAPRDVVGVRPLAMSPRARKINVHARPLRRILPHAGVILTKAALTTAGLRPGRCGRRGVGTRRSRRLREVR